MAGRKLSARAEEEVGFMEKMLSRLDSLARPIEEYANAKKNADQYSQHVTRALSEMRQHAMMKNLGPLADAAGTLSVQCARGSQMMRTRTMREGVAGLKQLIERTMKAAIDADQRIRHEEEKKRDLEQAARDRARQAVERARAAAAAEAGGSPPPPTPPAPIGEGS
jgi:thiamine phosphate synthase YjbQ (UPF0047 family)